MKQILDQIYQQGIYLTVKNQKLVIRGPKEVLTAELKDWLHQNKQAIIDWLEKNPRGIQKTDIDLDAEGILDAEIYPQKHLELSAGVPTAILLTGGTGFLGAFLLHDLLEQTEAEIYCLVRAKNRDSGLQRLQRNLESYGLWRSHFPRRIIPVLGDLTQPQLGLSEQEYEKLAQDIESIYHSGALVNWVYPYWALKEPNVLGTKEVLRLACRDKIKPVHYVSTVAVFESIVYAKQIITETQRPVHSQGVYLGYSQSKWVAEKLVLEASDRGLPVCVYRAPLISGDSHRGSWFTDDFVCRLLKVGVQMGTLPDLDYLLQMSPVDYVSQAIVYLSRQQHSRGKIFHLMNPQPLHLHDLVHWLNQFGYPVRQISYPQWLAQLQGIPVTENNALKPLLPFFKKSWSSIQLTLPELYQQKFKPEFDCELTRIALAGSSISCPPIDANLLTTYFQYFIEQKFLLPPRSLTASL